MYFGPYDYHSILNTKAHELRILSPNKLDALSHSKVIKNKTFTRIIRALSLIKILLKDDFTNVTLVFI